LNNGLDFSDLEGHFYAISKLSKFDILEICTGSLQYSYYNIIRREVVTRITEIDMCL